MTPEELKALSKEELLSRYAQMKKRISELEGLKELAQLEILDRMDDEATKGFETEFGSFKQQSRTTWEYSQTVKVMTEVLKKRKKEEEIGGLATEKQVSRFIIFKAPGDEDGAE